MKGLKRQRDVDIDIEGPEDTEISADDSDGGVPIKKPKT
jgi:hypothetical protein